jgi:capsule biosynthesis phosphatase
MIHSERALVMDVDGTLCELRRPDQAYAEVQPIADVVARLREYRAQGFYIILQSSRNMRTYEGNVGLLTARTAPELIDWLARHDIPYDELHLGKPWPGRGGFYVDDRAVRPDEFCRLSYEEILALTGGPGEKGGA